MAFYTIQEVAIFLKVHPGTVRRWIAGGRLQAIRLPGGAYRIPKAEVDRLQKPMAFSR